MARPSRGQASRRYVIEESEEEESSVDLSEAEEEEDQVDEDQEEEEEAENVQPEMGLPEFPDRGVNDPARAGVYLRTEDDRDVWVKLTKDFNMVPTKYSCDSATQAMGIHDDIWRMFTRIGWANAMQGRWLTYPVLVKEFLSSLDVQRLPSRGPIGCTFRLGNQDRELTTAQLNQIFQTPINGYFKYHTNYRTDQFWPLILDPDERMVHYDSGLAKASQIQNPVFRYLHRIISSTVLARHENSGLRKDELYMLWSMLQAICVDFGAFLLDQCKRQVQPSKGTIAIGGMITPIALALDIDLSNYEPLPGPLALNMAHLRNVRMISPHAAPIEFILKSGRKFPLPNPALTMITNFEDQRNWLMNTPEHNALMIAPEPGGVHLQRENEPPRAPRGQRRNRGDVADERLESLEGMMTTMNHNFTNFQGNVFTQFTDMRADFDARFTDMRESVDTRFTDMQADLDARFTGLQTHMDGRFSGMRTEFQGLQSNYSNLHGDYSHLRSDVSDIATMMRQWSGIGSSSQNPSQTFTPPFPPFQQYSYPYSGPFQFP